MYPFQHVVSRCLQANQQAGDGCGGAIRVNSGRLFDGMQKTCQTA
jgi:hypothetical protein